MRHLRKIFAVLACCLALCAIATVSLQKGSVASAVAEGIRAAAPVQTAYADEMSAGDQSHVYLVVIPNLRWDDVNSTDTPTLYALVKNYASCNTIIELDGNQETYSKSDNFTYLQLTGMSLTTADDEVADIFRNMGPDDSLVITACPSFATPQFDLEGYGATIIVDAGNNGLLTSTTTTHSGLIVSSDLNDAIADLIVSPQKNPGNTSVFLFSYLLNAHDRIAQLAKDNALVIAVAESKPVFTVGFVAWMALTFAFTILLALLKNRPGQRFRENAITATHLLWIVALSISPATLLMFVYVPTGVTPYGALVYCAIWVVLLSLAAALIGLRRCWADAMMFLLSATVGVIIVDRLLGGPLTQCGYLSYSPLGITRYFGIGNEGASILFGAWIMLATLLQCQHPYGRFTKPFRTWVFPLFSAFIVAIVAAPWWGANFGIIIWGSVAVWVAWALFNGRKITFRKVLAIIIAAGLLTAAVLVLDTTFNGESHLGAQLGSLSGAWYEVMFATIHDMLLLSWRTVVFSPPLAAAFFVIVAYLVWLRVSKRGPYSVLWRQNTVFKGAYTALLISAGLQLLTEDSGILMPALLLMYLVAGLTWIVCEGQRQKLYADELSDPDNRKPLFGRSRERRQAKAGNR